MENVMTTTGRILLGHIFVLAGLSKLGTAYAATQGWMEAMGVPGVLLPAVILLEIAGGAALILGFKARIVAVVLAGFCIIAGLLFHNNFADQMQMILFMKNLSIAGGLLFVTAFGPGGWSVDTYRANKTRPAIQTTGTNPA